MRRLVVTGTGRCGTRYASHVLRAAGVACGHEQVFTHRVALGRQPPAWGELQADSSWMAVPKLATVRVPAVLVVRHPLAVVHSMLQLGWFAPGRRRQVAAVIDQFRPEIGAEATRADHALSLWLHWNTAALGYVRAVVRMEDVVADPGVLLEACGVDAQPDAVALDELSGDPVRTNTKASGKRPAPRPEWGDFRPDLAASARRVARMFGYPTEEQ